MVCIKSVGVGLGVAAMLLMACGDDGSAIETGGTTTTSDATTNNSITVTTIPLPSDSSSGDTSPTTTSSSSDGGTSTGASATDSTGPADSSGGSSSGDPMGSSSSDGGPGVYDVQWCNLQYPPAVVVAVDEVFTVYVRLYAPGLTDLTGVTDPAPELVVEVGYGLDGSDPSIGFGAPWTWFTAMPNGGYGPGAPGYSAVNDEYQYDLSIDTAGIYDYAPRVSGDGGVTWVYCDIDGLSVGGYTPDQAGSADVGQ